MLGRYVNDSFEFDPARKLQAWGDVLPFVQHQNPETTLIAGNLECAGMTKKFSELNAWHVCSYALVLVPRQRC